MEKLKWCLGAKNGIELIEPNDNLAAVYAKKADDALCAVAMLRGNRDWEISSCYYAMYFGLYSVLMKAGIKCENHSCSIECMGIFLAYFSAEDMLLLKNAMKSRIDAQYYVNRNVSEERYHSMSKAAPSFIAKCADVRLRLKEKEINTLRESLKKMKRG